MDVLTRQQLEEQLERRRKVLEQLENGKAPQAAIEEARKKMRLTQRRLERMRAADYEESIESVQQLGGS